MGPNSYCAFPRLRQAEMKHSVLLVEDEPGLVVTLSDLLETEGYRVQVALDGSSALSAVRANRPDLIILDVMLPDMDGFEVCQRLRRRGVDAAILMLTARAEVQDRVLGLKLGADDYLVKPFDPAELLARVQALLRRTLARNRTRTHRFTFSDIEVDFERAEVFKGGCRTYMTGKELELLRYFVENPGKVLTREELLTGVWQYREAVNSRTVDVHIAWLRQKLESDSQHPRHFHTVRGSGYRFAP